MLRIKLILLFCFAISLSQIYAQEENGLEKTLSNLSQEALKGYTAPVISAFGSNLNSGWVTPPPSSKMMGLNVEIKFMGQASFFADDAKDFSRTGTFKFTFGQAYDIVNSDPNTQNQSETTKMAIANQIAAQTFNISIQGPTIVGDKNAEVTVKFPGGTFNGFTIDSATVNTGAQGFLGDIPVLPLAAIQLQVGTFYGTDLAIRFLPTIALGDLGDFSFYGIGILHNPSFYLKTKLPVDIGAGFFFQKMKVGDVFETKATQFGIIASKQIGKGIAIIPYGGLTIESSTTTININVTNSVNVGGTQQQFTVRETIELEGENSFGFTLGTRFKFGFFNLFVDFKIASTKTFNGGISFAF